jgi:glycosyltransferase involved in cell wall biosynthesis
MEVHRLRVAQVSSADVGGGAERVAADVHLELRKRGVDADLWVGHRRGDLPATRRIDNDAARSGWARTWLGNVDEAYPNVVRRTVAEPIRRARRFLGHEDFHFPATRGAVDRLRSEYDVVHLHNLHGQYFDLRELPRLTQSVLTIVTMHDAWLLSGHCAHSLDCERWRIGCGHCPDLQLGPAIRRDATAHNWKRKAAVFARSRVVVVCPSSWLADRVAQSLVAPAIRALKVIPNGVDLDVFRAGDKRAARSRLDIPQDADVLLFIAQHGAHNPFKDYSTLHAAIRRVARLRQKRLILLVLGGGDGVETVDNAVVRHVPFTADRARVAEYFRAATLFVHASLADTFPSVVLESLACGTPVLASAVGGIPEQIRPLNESELEPSQTRTSATGALVPPRRPDVWADWLCRLLARPDLVRQLGDNAVADARSRFGLSSQVDALIAAYGEAAQVCAGDDVAAR